MTCELTQHKRGSGPAEPLLLKRFQFDLHCFTTDSHIRHGSSEFVCDGLTASLSALQRHNVDLSHNNVIVKMAHELGRQQCEQSLLHCAVSQSSPSHSTARCPAKLLCRHCAPMHFTSQCVGTWMSKWVTQSRHPANGLDALCPCQSVQTLFGIINWCSWHRRCKRTKFHDPTETLVMSKASTPGEHEAPTLSDIIFVVPVRKSPAPAADMPWMSAQGSSETSTSIMMANFGCRKICQCLGVLNHDAVACSEAQSSSRLAVQAKHFHAETSKTKIRSLKDRRATKYSIPDLPGITARVQPSQDFACAPICLRWASHSAPLCPVVHESTGVFAKWRGIPFLFCSGLQLHGNADNVEPIRTSLLVPKHLGHIHGLRGNL